MPEVDGFMVVERIRRDADLAVSVIMMLTSPGHQADAGRCRELGLAAYLVKPVKQSDLLQAIQRTLKVAAAPDTGTAAASMELCFNPSNGTDRLRRHPAKASAAPGRLRILLAEDNAVNQRLGVLLLQKHGHIVKVVGNGKEALAALTAEAFDLLLMDVQMPEMDGLEATRAIRRGERGAGRHMPVIALTAYALKGDRELCLAAGMDGYVTKPIQEQELWQAIEPFLPATGPADGNALTLPSPPRGDGAFDAPSPLRSNGKVQGQAGSVARLEVPAKLIFDHEALLARVGGDANFLKQVTGLFFDEYPRGLQAMRDAYANRDAGALARSAHDFKSMVGSMGAPAAFSATSRLETQARRGNLAGASEMIADVEMKTEGLRAALAVLGTEDSK
jgi:two-component system sensor histidine kinase/response regulator